MSLRHWIFITACVVVSFSATRYPTAQDTPEPIEKFLAIADPVAGEKVFLQCRGCHTADEKGGHGIGPNLWNVVGRKIGTAPGYDYSSAMAAREEAWSFGNLAIYLQDPQRFVPGTRMGFPGIREVRDRVNVIAYLRGLSASPLPLPESAMSGPMPGSFPPSGNEEHNWEGLPSGRGRDKVFYACRVCHSLKIVQQQCLSRSSWDETLTWMVEEQGMVEPAPQDRKRILDYLAIHFGVEC
uniref:Sulfite dehydrogenase (Cytochrome) subunit SorB n=1 Tax=Candidatus Kentrum sp. FW TaxID=2126338 RepID=A0A450RVS6_9GAMM|nr:MAG: sulfite dehydrogenase (cytochrome) subunit SorB [Candidatus Kentron sp. FW]